MKIDVVSKLPPPSNVKPLRSFLRHTRFYERFIKGFSQIDKPLSNLLCVDRPFNFDKKYNQVFQTLRDVLTSAPILITPDWSQPFKLTCDASNVALGAMLGQKKDKLIHHIYYASKTLNEAQENYTTTKKELLVVVFRDRKVL